ncbi:hypothetical protein VXS72_15310 [Acinetobacter pittii]|uniref:hypothetical protein n=1 Tax=Acinetobacter pittii TaxID=48296 RepID=UPI002E16C5EC|nr:hypothetical protein [Acinetobacter pittii]
MLFTEDEINRLALFSQVTKIANSLEAIAQTTQTTIFFLNDRKYTGVDFFNSFKGFITQFDSFVLSLELNINDYRSIIHQFELSLSEDGFLPQYNENALVFNFIVKLKVFIDKFIQFAQLHNESFSMIWGNSTDLVYFYDLLNKIITFNNLSGGNAALENKIIIIEDQLNRLSNRFENHENLLKKEASSFFNNKFEDVYQEIKNNCEVHVIKLNELQLKYTYSLEEEINSLENDLKIFINSFQKADSDFKNTYDDYEILKKMVQAKGEQQITDHYKKRAFWERITYWVMTVGTFLIIILSICLALNGLDEYKEKTDIPVTALIEKYKDQPIEKIEKIYSAAQENALIYLVLRLIFSVLLFSSIIYTSRVAYRAYVHMRHSENMMLKLATLRPFINQLNEDERNQIHKDLVPDYFGKDAGMVDSTNEKFKDLPANVSAVAMKAIEQISGSGSNSSTEKNGKKSEGGTE